MSAKKAVASERDQHAAKDGLLAGIPDCCRRAQEAIEDAERRAMRYGRADLAAEARAILSMIRELWKDADKIIRPGAYQLKEEESAELL